jgi:hypothetical protein
MTLYVEADSMLEAWLMAVSFEKVRYDFEESFVWLHQGLSPEASRFQTELLEQTEV